ncbi:hypothetical protein Plec18170_008956 [Paecilomyces lecythidis]
MTLKACDQCFRNKEKCSFAPEAEICLRCRHLNIPCRVSRKKKRMGRPPITKSFTHGSLHIWHPGQDDGTQTDNSGLTDLSPVCGFDSTTASCLDVALSPEKENEQNMPLGRTLEEIIQYQFNFQTTVDAMRIVTHDQKFAVIHIPFAMGRSFMHDFRVAIHSILSHSASTITDGYLAFVGLVAHCQASRLYWTTPDLCRGAKGLQRLRDTKLMRPHDAIGILLLGQALFVFEILTDTFTFSGHSIVRSALISSKQWFPMLIQEPAFDIVTVCPLLLDTVYCLVYREVPVICPCVQNRIIVDRYVGVCATLLPLLYRLCERSHAAKFAVASASLNSEMTKDQKCPGSSFTDIEESIRLWTPTIPPDLFSAYDKAEVQMMMTQANVYQLAGLLIIHRLRYPLGIRDSTAQHYANCIFSEISSLIAGFTHDGAAALPITFPLLIAMFEVEGPGEELLEKLSSFTIQSICMSKLRSFVEYVRMAKNSGYDGLWFDLVENNLHFAVIP